MQELFGVSMNLLMVIMLAIFVVIMGTVIVMAWRNRVMLKLGLRNIPRRRGQTILIVVGSMLSAVIIAAAFGTGDTISFSIRSATIDGLGTIDEVLTPLGQVTSLDLYTCPRVNLTIYKPSWPILTPSTAWRLT